MKKVSKEKKILRKCSSAIINRSILCKLNKISKSGDQILFEFSFDFAYSNCDSRWKQRPSVDKVVVISLSVLTEFSISSRRKSRIILKLDNSKLEIVVSVC